MDQSHSLDLPFVESVFHPSDFSKASENAFAHALAIALLGETKLTIFHAGGSNDAWTSFPSVRATLARWGLVQPGSSKADIFHELALRIEKVRLKNKKPLPATLDYLRRHPSDLIVLATEGRDGMPRWMQPSLAERIAEKSAAMTLFVPAGSAGFVAAENGKFFLQRILVPVDFSPSPVPAIEYAFRTAILVQEAIEIVLLHIGAADTMPDIDLPEADNVTWKKLIKSGEVVPEISDFARANAVNLIVMSTAGKEGILDALRGSVTQQVLRRAHCPLLAVPTT